MVRRRRDSRLDRISIGPARVLSGYLAAIGSWPVVMWSIGNTGAHDAAFPTRWALLSVVGFSVWRVACQRQRRMDEADARRE
jgi:hypothetical protein